MEKNYIANIKDYFNDPGSFPIVRDLVGKIGVGVREFPIAFGAEPQKEDYNYSSMHIRILEIPDYIDTTGGLKTLLRKAGKKGIKIWQGVSLLLKSKELRIALTKAAWQGVKNSPAKLKRLASAIKTKFKSAALKGANIVNAIKENDLIYGLSTYKDKIGLLTKIKDSAGGKGLLLSDQLKKMGKDLFNDFGGDFWRASEFILDSVKKNRIKNIIHFDVQYIDKTATFLKKGPSSLVNSITSKELRWIKENWSEMRSKVKFYEKGMEIQPPWLKIEK